MQVNVTKRIGTREGRHYCPAVVNDSGRIKPDWVIVKLTSYIAREAPVNSNATPIQKTRRRETVYACAYSRDATCHLHFARCLVPAFDGLDRE
jgi:hypothetical protein